MKNTKTLLAFIIGAVIAFSSCVKDEPDVPPESSIPFYPDSVWSIYELKQQYNMEGTHEITGNYSVFGVCVMDERTGNIYQSTFIEDGSDGIQINFLGTSGIYLGDSVRIYLKGCTIDEYGGMRQLNNVNAGYNVEKIATRHFVTPEVVSISQLRTNINTYEGRVIQLNDVQFVQSELGETYADSIHREDINHTLEDCQGANVIVRTSGYANFANKLLPEGNGSFIAIAGHYNGDAQLTIRTTTEVNLTGERCGINVEIPEPNITIPELKALYQGQRLQINNDLVIGAHVVANDESGNYYKTIVIQDDQGGIELKINDYDLYQDFPVGQEIYVKCQDLFLDTYGGVVQLGSTYEDGGEILFGGIQPGSLFMHVVKGPNVNPVEPTEFTISQIGVAQIGMLVKLPEVQFAENELGQTWAAFQLAKNRTLQDCFGSTIIVRTSGYADFWGEPLPEGNGDLVAVVSAFNGDMQLYVRDLNDVDLTGERCDIGGGGEPILSTTFDDGWENWSTVSETGAQVWGRENSFGPDGSACAQINGYSNGYNINHDWLISPEINLLGYSSAFLSFESAKNYTGDNIVIKVTDNFTGDPATTNWTTVSATLSTGGYNWTESGSVNVSSFANGSLWVAFEYTSTSSTASDWRIDNVEVKVN
ncbi:MAG: choice-of-anchor J domain-containing protein [Bacteroidales bacterium]|nr:choice-of-anchor J domain-containing protein [Bacteroidales bacterium]